MMRSHDSPESQVPGRDVPGARFDENIAPAACARVPAVTALNPKWGLFLLNTRTSRAEIPLNLDFSLPLKKNEKEKKTKKQKTREFFQSLPCRTLGGGSGKPRATSGSASQASERAAKVRKCPRGAGLLFDGTPGLPW